MPSSMKQEVRNSLGKLFLTTQYELAHHWVYNNWIGYQSFDSIVQGANVCLGLIAASGSACLLNDNREVLGPWNHAVEWIASDWTPRAVANGLQYFAHVVSDDSLAKVSSEEMHQKVEGFEMRMFSDIEEAKSWLNAKKKLVPSQAGK